MKRMKLNLFRMEGLFLIVLLFGISLTSCKKIDASKGDMSWKSFSVSSQFNGIDFALTGTLTFTESSNTSIEVYATEKVLENLEVKVENNTLKIKMKNGYSIINGDNIQVNVSAPNISNFYNSGSGNFYATLNSMSNYSDSKVVQSGSGNVYINRINSFSQEVILSGSGSINIDSLYNTTTTSTISGSGVITVSGTTGNSDITISGSGNFNGFNYITDITEVLISASGNARVYADSLLNVSISGSGSVKYKGYPSINVSGSGSGTVTDAN